MGRQVLGRYMYECVSATSKDQGTVECVRCHSTQVGGTRKVYRSTVIRPDQQELIGFVCWGCSKGGSWRSAIYVARHAKEAQEAAPAA